MFVKCKRCTGTFDDQFRSTLCPHHTFAANDGRNNFKHHHESPVIFPAPVEPNDAEEERLS